PQKLRRLYAAEGDEDDTDDEGESDQDLPSGPKKGSSKQRGDSPDLRKVLVKGLASGQSANDLLPAMMMALLLDKDRSRGRKKSREDADELGILGGSDSDDSGIEGASKSKGMRAVASLNKLHKQIQTRPRRICELFEKEVIEDLGIVRGQAWTVKDFVRKQHWGKFKGIFRCAMMDVAVYEYLRNNQPEIAAAQVVQNLKAKMQSVLAGGDWSAAWLLTGLPDPIARREFVGSKEEMAVVSGYVEALAKLQKRVKDVRAKPGDAVQHPILASRTLNSSFYEYFMWFEGVQGHRLERSGTGVPLFPCMLPYPEAVVAEGETMEEGQVCDWWSKAFVNTFMAWGNFVTLGCPRPGGSAYEPRVGYLSMEGIRARADKLLGEVREFACLDLVLGRLSCDGKKGAIDALISKVQCTVGASYFKQFGQVDGGVVGSALPVSAARVAIPKKAGTVDPCEWLDPDKAHALHHLEEYHLLEHLWSDVVRACHRVPQEEEASLARRLLEADMAVLVPERELPRNRAGELMPGGLFCVAKNQTEVGTFASGVMLLPDVASEYNAVGRQVDRAVVAEFGGDPKVPYRLCFRVLGMGDLNACDVAQAVHEAVLRKRGVLDPAHTLHYGEHVSDSDLWEGAYLDDLLIAQKITLPYNIPLDGSFEPPAAQVSDKDFEQVVAAEGAYKAAGLERAVRKAFRFEPRFRAWGAEVDGIQGRVSSPLDVRRQVWMILMKIVTGGWCSREVLQKTIGYLAFVFQYRREFYSLQHHVYRYLERMPAGKWVPLPGYILDELRSCSLHLPFARWDMRRAIHSSLLATDATPSSGGAVEAPITEELARALWKHAELKGEAARLDDPGALQWLAPRAEEASRFASSVALCLPWRVVSSYHFRETSHINLQEARALRKELIRLAADPANYNTVILALNDSRVVIGSFVKGGFYDLGYLPGAVRHQAKGLEMREPIGLSWGNDAFDERVTKLFTEGTLCWAWMAPPRRRPRKCMLGSGFGTIANIAILQGAFFVIEHSKRSVAWKLPGTQQLISTEGMKLLQIDWDAYDEGGVDSQGMRKPSRVLTNAPWLEGMLQQHPGGLQHAPRRAAPMRKGGGDAAYPEAFCRVFADALVSWAKAGASEDRHSLRESSTWLLNKARELGATVTRRTPARTLDRVLAATVEHCYQEGERLYKVTLGVLGLQRTLRIAGPLAAIKGWQSLQPVKSRVPISKYVLECLLVTLMARALGETGRDRERYLAAMLSSWVCFEALLRPGEAAGLLVGDVCLPDPGSLRGGGATHLFRVTENIALLQFAGRWARQETVKSYLQEGLALQVACSASEAARGKLAEAHAEWPHHYTFGGMDRGASQDNLAALLEAAHSAAAQLGDEPLDAGLTAAEVLQDPSACATAARWKAGSVAGGWRTWLVLVLVLLFPRVVALLIALVVRLCVRGLSIVLWLSELLLGSHSPPQPPLILTDGAPPPAPPPATGSLTTALPARPFDFVTLVLLVWNLYRNRLKFFFTGMLVYARDGRTAELAASAIIGLSSLSTTSFLFSSG
ncbi:SMYD3, partial [Symbiodinium sp. CCMP2456]